MAKGNKFVENMLPVGIIDNIAFSKKDVWAWYRIPGDPFDFLSHDQKVSYALSMNGALNALMGDAQDKKELKFVSTSVPVNINAWETQMRSIAAEKSTAIGFDAFLRRQVNFLKSREFMTRVSYLGVHLGKRGALNLSGLNPLEMGVRASVEMIKDWGATMLQTPTAAMDAFEEKRLRLSEEETFRTLSTGSLGAIRCSSEEIVLNLIKKNFYPAMPAPELLVDLDNRIGPGDILYESTSVIEKYYHYLKMSQVLHGQTLEGYRSTMVFERFPAQMAFPFTYPFLAFPSKMGASFTVYGHLTLVPSAKMKKEVEKKRKESKDELQNMAGATSAADAAVGSQAGAEVSNSLQDLNRISEMLAADASAWCYGNYRLVLEAPTPEYVQDYASLVQQAYSDMDIKVRVAAGAQLSLLQEIMPTSPLMVKPFQQITSLTMLSTSGWNISSALGDEVYGAI